MVFSTPGLDAVTLGKAVDGEKIRDPGVLPLLESSTEGKEIGKEWPVRLDENQKSLMLQKPR